MPWEWARRRWPPPAQARDDRPGKPGWLPGLRFGDGPDRFCLRAAVALHDVEFDPLALFQGAVTIHLDGRVVHEHVPAIVDRDEAVTLVRVEPLNGALSHCPTTP